MRGMFPGFDDGGGYATAHLAGSLRRPVENRAGVRVGIEILLLKISFVPSILFPLNFNSV
jgi:uncharacterized protein (DUF934 family)